MEKIPGYDESPAFTGESQALPAGAYVCEIKSAQDTVSSGGRKQLVLLLDVAEGDYKGYYQNRYRSDMERSVTETKWKCVFRQGYEGNSLPYFRGMIESIKRSNPGYVWDWNEKGLKGKRVGVIFGREQFRAGDGSLKWATKPMYIRSIDGLKNARIPEDKPISEAQSWGAPTSAAIGQNSSQYGFDGFDDIDASEEDLPF